MYDLYLEILFYFALSCFLMFLPLSFIANYLMEGYQLKHKVERVFDILIVLSGFLAFVGLFGITGISV